MDIILKKTFGYDKFRDYQKDIIDYIIKGIDCLVIMPTGSGKSLCYQMPALITDKITIVISPLIAIMEQQVDDLSKFNIKCKYYDSSDNTDFIYDIINYQIIFITPEKICNQLQNLDLIKQYIGLIAIDECHCISEWGHNFRPSYTKIGEIKVLYPNIPMVGLTATATNQVQTDIINKLNLDITKTALIKSSIYRSNLKYVVRIKVDLETDLDQLYQTDVDKTMSTIIYTNTIKNTDKICDYLINKHNIKCINYYSNIDKNTKKEIHDLFIENKIHCLVATIAYGMGVHKNDIRRIVHYTPPSSIEQYCQQTGRAGRDTKDAECIMYYNNTDFSLPHNKNNIESANHMNLYCCTTDCRNKYIIKYFDENSNKIENCSCDNCNINKELVQFDLTNQIKLLLNTIYYTKEIYGTGIIVDILRGSKKKQILQKNLDKLETYGTGKNYTITWWKYVITLIQSKYNFIISGLEYNNLILTNAGKQLLYINYNKPIILYLPCLFNKL